MRLSLDEVITPCVPATHNVNESGLLTRSVTFATMVYERLFVNGYNVFTSPAKAVLANERIPPALQKGKDRGRYQKWVTKITKTKHVAMKKNTCRRVLLITDRC